MKILIGLWI